MSRPPIAKSPLSKLKNNSSFATTRRSILRGLMAGGTARRAGAFLAFFAIVATIFYTGSSSAASPRDKAGAASSLRSEARRPAADSSAGARLLSPAMFQLFTPDEVSIYAADCATPKTDFNLGETACARATFPASLFSFRSLTWVDTDNNILNAAFITSSGQTSLFVLPATATSEVGGNIVDNRGTWRVDLRSADGSRPATASFNVHEPANPRADLQLSAGSGNRIVESGANVTVRVVVHNAGPDAATNLEVSAPSVPGLSLDSLTDALSLDCGTDGVCSLASLPRGEQAIFVATYSVTAAGGTSVTAQASVTSDTEDPRPSSNSDSFSFTVAQATGETQPCTLTPPAPITVNGSDVPDPNDPAETLYGATVTYTVDAEGDSCSPVQCDVPSGSLFAPGTTLVTCTAASGDSTTFPVTVIDTRSFRITLNGANPMTVECNSIPPFADPGATTNRPGITPTVTSNVNPNAPGTYTITYTATDGTATATATRTVNVIDDSPPHITLNGDDPLTDEVETEVLTIECHSVFTDPGATAIDACDGPAPVSVNSNLDPNTVGTYTIVYSATDNHGTPGDSSDDLVASITRTVHVVDTTAPVISCPADIVVTLPPNTTAISMPVNFNVTASDSCSTTVNVTTSHASGAIFPLGTTTVNATATDQAGHTSSCSFNVTVHYLFTGFFSPISNLPVLNTVKAGSAIPIKFSLSGNKGLNIFAADSPASGVVGCNSNDPAVDLTEIDTPGASGLTYNAGSGQYHYNWKTLKAWEGTCRQLVVTLNDGSQHRANFKFK